MAAPKPQLAQLTPTALTGMIQVSIVLVYSSFSGYEILFSPMESSNFTGLVPTDGSIMVISNRDANSRKSSFSPKKP